MNKKLFLIALIGSMTIGFSGHSVADECSGLTLVNNSAYDIYAWRGAQYTQQVFVGKNSTTCLTNIKLRSHISIQSTAPVEGCVTVETINPTGYICKATPVLLGNHEVCDPKKGDATVTFNGETCQLSSTTSCVTAPALLIDCEG